MAKTFHDTRGPRALTRDCDRFPTMYQDRRVPSCRALYRMLEDDSARAVDGCKVPVTGECEHGSPSWLRALEVIS